MKIAIIGLGLIGGSFAKSIKSTTLHEVYGMDIDKSTEEKALSDGAIDGIIGETDLKTMNLTIVCLYPLDTVNFILNNADNFQKGSIVIDICGVKEYTTSRIAPVLEGLGVFFLGTHPMAGREFSGYDYSSADLFHKASYIITPMENSPQIAVDLITTLASCIGFGKVVLATPIQHDKNIAYTSQLAHIVSNAYVKSPALFNSDGFSAGSFLDLTRVAKLNPKMWGELFLCNKDVLVPEIDNIISNLEEYRDALNNLDNKLLFQLLDDGTKRKEKSMEYYGQEK